MSLLRESLAGRYDLVQIVGRGGMGVVYRSHDRVLSRTVAVKVLPQERADDPAWVARLAREARSAAGLSHPNIVSIFDTGVDAGTHFIVMEYVEGRNLSQMLSDRPVALARAVRLSSQIASALGAAHRAGIVHRDIKPTNVMVDRSGSAKVLDFGIARAADSTTVTQTAVVVGSAPYMAPEVARGEPADQRSDIYSLGCVVYELITGTPPFTGEGPLAILHQHNAVRPRPPRELNPDVPAALDGLVLRMLAKESGDRPQSATELAAELERSVVDGHAPRPSRPLPARLLALAAIALVLIAVLLLSLLGSSKNPTGRAGAAAGSAAAIRRHRLVRPRHHAAPVLQTQAPQTPTAPSQTTTAAPTKPAGAPPTVAQAAGALTTLVTQDLQSGAIDQHGQDLLSHLQDVLNSFEQGNAPDAIHKLDDLVKHEDDLIQHGDIRPSAVGPLNGAIARLRDALLRQSPPVTKP